MAMDLDKAIQDFREKLNVIVDAVEDMKRASGGAIPLVPKPEPVAEESA
jgi:hypothetical protein